MSHSRAVYLAGIILLVAIVSLIIILIKYAPQLADGLFKVGGAVVVLGLLGLLILILVWAFQAAGR